MIFGSVSSITAPFRSARRWLGPLMLLIVGAPALAGAPDLRVTYLPPPLTAVYSPGAYGVRVANIGNADAVGVELTIEFPKTNTSPQVYIMGNLQPGYGTLCQLGGPSGTVGGTRLICNLGLVKRNKQKTVSFSVVLPEKTGTLMFASTATTQTTPETNPANNTNIPYAATLDYYDNTITFDNLGEAAYSNGHCTGTALTAYFECTKFPSSISSFSSVFHDDNTITIPSDTDYLGAWTIVGDTLTFNFTSVPTGQIEVEFRGRGVPTTGCWEGLSRFPDGNGGYSTYVAPYRVCPQ